jgi:hypothetical protein
MDDHLICKKNNIEAIKAMNRLGFFKDEIDFLKDFQL